MCPYTNCSWNLCSLKVWPAHELLSQLVHTAGISVVHPAPVTLNWELVASQKCTGDSSFTELSINSL